MNRTRVYLCAYFPEWSINVTQRKLRARDSEHKERPIALTSQNAAQIVIKRCCARSALAGVRPMMSLALAEALCPDMYSEPFDPVRDYDALYKLAVWCLRYSPLVGLDAELCTAHGKQELDILSSLHYGIIIDLSGTERLHGSPQNVATALWKLFRRQARIGVAPTIGGAWALSRYTEPPGAVVLSPAKLQDSLASLSTLALRISPQSAADLAAVGIETIGELLTLPKHALSERFGKALLSRLHQALGDYEEQLRVVEPPTCYERRKVFEPPLIHRRAIVIAIEHIFKDLITELSARQIGAGYFSLCISDTSAATTHKEFPLASATNNAKHLLEIIEPIIDSMRFCGEVREINLRAHSLARTTTQQRSFTEHKHDSTDIARSHTELLNSFTLRIGKDRVVRAVIHDSFIPERSFSYTSISQTHCDDNHQHSVMEPRSPYNLRERPPTLFTTPEPIHTLAMLPDKPPSRIQWRGKHLSIISGTGPERIAPEWWRTHLQNGSFAGRDYFTIQDDAGRWLWVFREASTQRWFVHGVWN
jgi:protein ImuB